MAKTAARTLVADLTGSEPPAAYAAVPSFWSDQFGIRIQGIGAPHRATGLAVLEGSLDAVEDGVVIRYDRDGLAVGVVTIGLPAGRLVHFRKLLGQPTPISDRTAETVGVAS
nr:oxidoreductase C-terminal domain-containing protein [Micrococcus sp. TA1]